MERGGVQHADRKKTELLEEIKKYETLTDAVEQPRILLAGQVQAGKSSFINSVNSIFRGYPIFQATVGYGKKSVTKNYRAYTISDSKGGGKLPFIFCDTMGMKGCDNDVGILTQDVFSMIDGYVPDNYKFDPITAMSTCKKCTEKPSLADQVHCIVYVVDASTAILLEKELLKMFQKIQKKACNLGIPQLLLLTKVDFACNIVKDDLTKVYKSRYIHETVIKVSQMVGVPVACILPVRNYWCETELDMKVDILILKALQQILRQADACFDEIKQRRKSEGAPPLSNE
ncbi:interferon-induced protein 44-like isoform X2 [Polypterus senegalus]|uniref:interferon-induced protein 44-like isoform X2 n=1 Tax=Polypterus senegalus TaxID=55291 RepID=UPI00196588C0|nr:interferon-induced protein 44-like isoform X2 [Polypterus senegalus]